MVISKQTNRTYSEFRRGEKEKVAVGRKSSKNIWRKRDWKQVLMDKWNK